MNAEEFQRDFAPFADPATEFVVKEGTHGVGLQLVRNGKDHDYFFNLANGTMMARHDKNKKYATVRSLLASREFADIRGLASTQARMLKSFDENELIPPEGTIGQDRLTRDSLREHLSPVRFANRTGNTKIGIALLDGPAGVGKTSLIRSMCAQRARGQHETAALPPILHVENRGKRLAGSALNELLAEALDLIRANLTFDQTSTLVRHNLLQIAVDGFDELVDAEGYKDSWFALRYFFEETLYGGPIILAGRDTFFDQQSFVRQLESAQYEFELSHIRLAPVTPSTARGWLKQQGWPARELNDPYTNIIFRAGSYTLRPYFLKQLAGTKGWKEIESRDLTPRAFLVEEFLTREAGLLSNQLSSIPSENIKPRLSNLFEDIALEMADFERDSIEPGSLQLATEIAFDGLVDRKDLGKLLHKSASFALLEKDVHEGYRRFPHTEISHHFLAAALIRMIANGVRPRVLRRGALTSDFLSIFAESFERESGDIARKFVANLEPILVEEVAFDRLADNAASLLVTALCHDFPGTVRKYSDISLVDAVLFGMAGSARLERVKVQRLDAREAELQNVEFVDCEVANLTVDETTRFGNTRPNIHQLLQTSETGDVQELFGRVEISKWLDAHSAKPNSVSSANRGAVRLFEKICRVMLRQHMIKEHQSDASGALLQEKYWDNIQEILFERKVLDRIKGKPTRGPAATFIRMRDPYRFLVQREDDQEAKLIWDEVGAIPV